MPKFLFAMQRFWFALTHQNPRLKDAVILSIFVVLITWQPFYLHGFVNWFELGIYLPGIDALLDGKVPYRDFFHLRGPLELYIPAGLMLLFGEKISVLSSYFYVGTVITLVICVFIAKELYKTRLVLYLMIPVLVGRTFPRAVFHVWGGLRFGVGLFAILFAIYYLKRQRLGWIVLSGITTGLAFLISSEMGVCASLTILMTWAAAFFLKLLDTKKIWRSLLLFIAGAALILLPYGMYLFSTQSLLPYLDCIYSVAANMTKIFPDYLFEDHPKNFLEALWAMNPLSPHFKHLTPAYYYLSLGGYFLFRIKKRPLTNKDLPLIVVGIYGLIMYLFAFRKIGAGQFEMALQPEKILLFFLLEEVFLFLKAKSSFLRLKTLNLTGRRRIVHLSKIYGMYFLMLGFIMSSLGYAVQRYNHRFPAFKMIKYRISGKDLTELMPLKEAGVRVPSNPRLEWLVMSKEQAEDFQQIKAFVDQNTSPGETVFMYPELGAYHFIVDRPFVGRFPMASFSWINDRWHEELGKDLESQPPRFAVLAKDWGDHFYKVYFKIPKNKENFDQMMNYLQNHYSYIASTGFLDIYQRHE